MATLYNFSCDRTIVELINRLTFTALPGFPTVVTARAIQIEYLASGRCERRVVDRGSCIYPDIIVDILHQQVDHILQVPCELNAREAF